MRRACIAAVVVLAIVAAPQRARAQVVSRPDVNVASQPSGYAFSLHINPVLTIPVGPSSSLFSVGGGAVVAGEYRLRRVPWLLARAELDYVVGPIRAEQTVSLVSLAAGGGAAFVVAPVLGLSANVVGGLTYAFFNPPSPFEGYVNGYAKAGLDAHLFLTPALTVHAGAAFLYQVGLYTGLAVSLGGSVRLGQTGAPAWGVTSSTGARPRWRPLLSARSTEQLKGLDLEEVELQPLFPVFYTYYDDHPLATVTVRNTLDEPLTEVRASFFLKDYMSAPQRTRVALTLAPRESKRIELTALLTDRILEVTERTKLQVEIGVSYAVGEREGLASRVETLQVLDRNAMTWEDDRRAAPFVTPKDTAVMAFAKGVAGAIKGKASPALNANLCTAMAVHGAWGVYGMAYVIDPKSSYAQLAANKQVVDYLQFPRQTLAFRAGDCDDLSILACALLESVGIETAFITVPGHIFMAFSLGMKPEEARKAFPRVDELIFRGETSWVPVEITEIAGGFMKAWEQAAKEWRQAQARGLAAFLPLHEAWTLYEPVFFKGEEGQLALPAADRVAAVFLQEQGRYVEREIYGEVAKLEGEIQKSNESPKSVNKLGVLFARYGLYDRAEKQFLRAVQQGEYVPSLINLGNIRLLEEDNDGAGQYYERAQKLEPENALVLVGLARVSHAQENYGAVRRLYDRLKTVDGKLAEQFAYLEMRGQEAGRAADASGAREVMLWQEE